MIGDPTGRNVTRPPLSRGRTGRQREDVYRPGLSDSRPRPHRSRVQLDVALGARRRRHDQARRQVHGGAHARARRLRQALSRGAAHRGPRVPVSVGAGLRLGGAARRRRARRHRPEIQPAGRARAAAALRTGTAMHPHAAAARRPRRREQDVEVARQLRRHHRGARGTVRQADVDLRRADVALLRAPVVSPDGRNLRVASANAPRAATRATPR